MLRDLLGEAISASLARPQRMALTALGTMLGIGALVATVGLADTAGAQIVSRFDELAATEVIVRPAARAATQGELVSAIPWDAETRLARLNGVVAAGTMSKLDLPDLTVRTTSVVDPLAPDDRAADVVAGSPGLLGAVRGTIGSGRWFDAGHSRRADPVVVLGATLAATLHVADVGRHPAVFLGDRAYTVVGILDGVAREPALLNAVIIPDGTAAAAFGLTAPQSVRVDTRVGAARLISSQAPTALAPQSPDALEAAQAPEPAAVRAKVARDVQSLFLVLGLVSLVIGAVGIANTTLVSVLERTSEIGLRRSLGATRGQVAGQFLLESAGVGLFGGILGASTGIVVVTAVSYVKEWTPVLAPWLPAAAVAAGTVVGLLAGAYPAHRASGIEPIAALRAEG
ncbi:ABC transporter permease [Asanoa siamensis]|uniref:ABC transporter permease n=1 Tax=Asanoa siamensis TaxID=926357 RepID=A0ABQ4CVC2_9ACTN|nr:ABC transporter permease [Asanoa siamensis]GIF75237.1 ABC transporter permease [Asanoa siamensis]